MSKRYIYSKNISRLKLFVLFFFKSFGSFKKDRIFAKVKIKQNSKK